jgi:hypothetical protein
MWRAESMYTGGHTERGARGKDAAAAGSSCIGCSSVSIGSRLEIKSKPNEFWSTNVFELKATPPRQSVGQLDAKRAGFNATYFPRELR